MKRYVASILIAILIMCLLSGCAKVYDDPFLEAKDGERIQICGIQAEFYDASNAGAASTYPMLMPFDHKIVFAPDRPYYLIKVLEVRDICFTREGYDTKGNLEKYEKSHSVMTAEIISVFRDTLGFHEGDVVTMLSYISSETARGNVFYPEYKEDSLYYTNLMPMNVEAKETDPYYLAIDELADCYVQHLCYGIMPVRSDGMVEFYHAMLPNGKILPYPENIGPVWAELPQDEFEAGLKELLETYGQ